MGTAGTDSVDTTDGSLSKSELNKFLLSVTGHSVNETALTDIFVECDADAKGAISKDKLVKYINGIRRPSTNAQRRVYILRMEAASTKTFRRVDEDMNGGLSKSELDEFLLSTTGKPTKGAALTDIFVECDADGSGAMVPQEKLVEYIHGSKKPTTDARRHVYILRMEATRTNKIDFAALSATNIAIANLFRSVDEDGSGELSKDELDKLLLSSAGKSVNETVLTDIFQECDADGSGAISLEEFVEYVDGIKPPTRRQRLLYILHQSLRSILIWAFSTFLIGLTTSIAIFARERTGRGPSDAFNWSGFTGLLFVSGCFAFIFIIEQLHAKKLALEESATEKIALWAMDQRALSEGQDLEANMFSEEVDEELGMEVFHEHEDSMTLCIRETVEFGPQLSDHAEMTVADLKAVLEKSSVFLPLPLLKSIFEQIDTDKGGTLSLKEIQEYADTHQNGERRTALQFELRVLAECSRHLVFWLMWGYEIGSILYAVNAFWVDDPFVKRHIYGAGSLLFFLSAFLSFWFVYQKHTAYFGYVQYLNTTMQSLAMSCKEPGMDDTEAYERLFAKIDTGGEDGAVEFDELHEALMEEGVVIPLEVLRSVYTDADENGDGDLQMEEFVEYLQGTAGAADLSRREKRWASIKRSVKDAYFWNAMCQVTGGLFYTIASWPAHISPVTAADLYVTASLCYWLASLHYIWEIIRELGNTFDAIQHSKLKFKEMVLAAAATNSKDSVHSSTSSESSCSVSGDWLCSGCQL